MVRAIKFWKLESRWTSGNWLNRPKKAESPAGFKLQHAQKFQELASIQYVRIKVNERSQIRKKNLLEKQLVY